MLRDTEVNEDDIGVLFLCPVKNVLWLDISVHDVVVVQVLDGREHRTNRSTGVALGETATLKDTIEELATAGLFKNEIVLSSTTSTSSAK